MSQCEIVYPDWLDRNEYPFQSHFFETSFGKMHYVDEGEGFPIVFVHATPGWSFEFREIIKELSKTNRCIAIDHIGFGLSEKPISFDYRAESHAANFSFFINSLSLNDVTLVVHDWGGPIALSWAMENPEKIRKLIIMNSMLFSVKEVKQVKQMVSFVGSKLGWFLVKEFNFFAKTVMKMLIVNKDSFPKHIHRHFYLHLGKKEERKGTWVFPRELVDADNWLKQLWSEREKINHIPTTFIWGMKSIAMKEEQLNIWIEGWHTPKIIKIENAGHFPHIDQPKVLISELKLKS